MEHEYAELKMKLREVSSCLLVLQQAVENENQTVTFSNIDDNLEIIIEKLNASLKQLDTLTEKQFSNSCSH